MEVVKELDKVRTDAVNMHKENGKICTTTFHALLIGNYVKRYVDEIEEWHEYLRNDEPENDVNFQVPFYIFDIRDSVTY